SPLARVQDRWAASLSGSCGTPPVQRFGASLMRPHGNSSEGCALNFPRKQVDSDPSMALFASANPLAAKKNPPCVGGSE
ncbi:MAG TPA: hypothetical protein PKH05_07005, partial [Nitrospira sp.]|nr:hypothetical protein [Nitrospira sp.]